MKRSSLAGFFCLFACLAPDSASGQASAEGGAAAVIADFADPSEVDRWHVVNDGVMGGKSRGGIEVEEGAMHFAGVINTDGGGFSSVRRALEPGALKGASSVRLRVRGDGRGYRVSFRDGTRTRWGGEVMHAAPLNPDTQAQATDAQHPWAEIVVNFEDLTASFRGRDVDVERFDPERAREIGVILADGVDGPFKLEIAWIHRDN